MIEFRTVTKLYGTVIGVNDLSLSLPPGTYGLLGPNGSGKTTLINLVLGQLRPTLGVVRLFGTDPWRNESVLRRIGYCPTSELLVPHLSAFEWVAYQTELNGFSIAEARERAEDRLTRLGMANAMHRPIGTYSLGMRQRTKLAQAITHDPELLILDEPFNGLDPVARHEMILMLQQWQGEGRSLLLASHVLHEVEAVKPSFMLMSGGRMLASGSPREVRDLLVDLPNEIEIEVDNARRMAAVVVGAVQVESLKVEADDRLAIVTRHSREFFEALPRLVRDHGLTVRRLTTRDESLQDLFTTLMRRHRGEI